MARISPRIINKTTQWSANARPRVGQTKRHNGYDWVNITGKNSEPGLSSDWKNMGIAIDSPTQVGNQVVQLRVTDLNDNEHMIVSGTFLGGDPSKLESYSPNSIIRAL